MPIFHNFGDSHDGSPPEQPTKTPPKPLTPLESVPMERTSSEESIRTDLCEGPVPDSLEEEPASYPTEELNTGFAFPLHGTSDRLEYIARLKNGESPTWFPNRNLESLLGKHDITPTKPASDTPNSSPLLPSPELSNKSNRSALDDLEKVDEQRQAGLQIERPRSALHSGDFTEGAQENKNSNGLRQSDHGLFGSDGQSWLATSPARNLSPFQLDSRFPSVDQLDNVSAWRSRAPSLSSSFSSSFIFKAPTSPLVQSESNDDLELSSFMNPIDISLDGQRNPRRHTLQASHSMHSTPSIPTSSSFSRHPPSLRRDSTYPYQAHQPRRSLTSNPTPHPSPSPHTPSFLRTRRPSFTTDSSPLHASMVGSYEESILRGRMSTTPSKPLDFVAQIGVLGLGKCKANLRCPSHVTLPFPAVFYSYETTSHGRVGKPEDGPSPYVGQIDLENGLPNTIEARENKRKRLNTSRVRGRNEDLDMIDGPNTNQLTDQEIRRAEKQKRRATSPRAPPGGSYRIPEKGQLQIIIKNPNKTAVKLFLIPYDLAGMEPGTKTFIRQRSYSAGDSALPTNPLVTSTINPERQTLRYLVHLHICSPSRGRFYLYKSIRVVFANRVPDGKEKLKNEITTPEPRFTVYKPGRDSSLGHALSGGAGASLAAEKAFRRRSSGYALGTSNRPHDTMEGITQALERGFSSGSVYPPERELASTTLVQPIPFSLFPKRTQTEDDAGQQQPSNMQSPVSSRGSRPPTSQGGPSMSWDSNSTGISGYGKLNKGDAGYGGNIFSTSPDGKQKVAEGLLAKKLRDLGVGVQSPLGSQDGI